MARLMIGVFKYLNGRLFNRAVTFQKIENPQCLRGKFKGVIRDRIPDGEDEPREPWSPT